MKRAVALTVITAACVLGICAAVLAAGGFGFIRAWGTSGTAPGMFNGPDQIAVDTRGDVYVVDRDNGRLEKFTSQGDFLGTVGVPGEFSGPRGVTTDGLGNVYVADSGHNRVDKFNAAGALVARYGRNHGDGTPGTGNGEFNDPRGLAVDTAGNLWVADHGNNRIQELSPAGRFLARFGRAGGDGSAGSAPGEFNKPRSVTVDRHGDIYVADKLNNRIQKLDASGHPLAVWGRSDGAAGAGPREFATPYSVALDPSGNLYVADNGNNRVQELSGTGAFITAFGRNGGDGSAGSGNGEFRTPYGVAVDCRGALYVTDEGNDRVEKFGPAGESAPVCPAKLRLGTPTRRMLRDRGIRVPVTCDRPCTVELSARIVSGGRVVARLQPRERRLLAAVPARLRVRLARGAAVRLRRLFASGARPALVLRGSATSFAGRSQLVTRTRRLAAR